MTWNESLRNVCFRQHSVLSFLWDNTIYMNESLHNRILCNGRSLIYLKSNPGIDCSLLWCTRHRKMLCNFFLTNVVTNGSILFSITSLRFAFWSFICSDKAKTSKECNNIIELVICFPIKWYAWLILPRLLYSQLWI